MASPSSSVVNVEEIMREIRARVERRRQSASGPAELLIGPGMAGPDVSALNDSLARVRERRAGIGTLPASPPTVRGQIGSLLVSLVRRMLFWYTPQLKDLAESISEALENHVAALENLGRATDLAPLRSDLQKLRVQTADAQGKLEAQVAAVSNQVAEVQRKLEARIDALSSDAAAAQGKLEAQAAALSTLSSQMVSVSRKLTDVSAASEYLSGQIEGLPASADLARIQSRVAAQERRLTVLLQEARRRLPEPFDEQQLKRVADESRFAFEALYVTFEDEFRGTREEIKQRLAVYLPHVRAAGCGAAGAPILDIGCGRGEWLEVLRDNSLEARGIDINLIMVERCRELGLTVEQSDAFEYLKNLPEASVGAVTGFHILEHLPWERLLEGVDEIVRVLRPGGLAIFETPNPENVLVGSYGFHLDPTHRTPLPAPLLRFVVEARGFCDVRVLKLQPDPEALKVTSDGGYWSAKLSQYFYGPRDYGILATKV